MVMLILLILSWCFGWVARVSQTVNENHLQTSGLQD